MINFDFINPYFIYMSFVLFTAFSIYAIFTYKEWFTRNRNKLFIVAAILVTWTQIARYIIVGIQGDFDITDGLPFFMCRISVVVLMYYTYTRDKKVHSFLFYWGALGIAGVLYPNGPINDMYLLKETFFIDHYLLAVTPFYLVAHENYKPSKKDMYFIVLLMLVMLFAFIPINDALGSDYFYINDQSIFKFVIPNAPGWLYIIVHTLTALGFFSIYYMWFGTKENIKKVTK